jgi:hypothetical protein
VPVPEVPEVEPAPEVPPMPVPEVPLPTLDAPAPEVPVPVFQVFEPEPELVDDDSEAPEPDELDGEVWLVVTPEPLAASGVAPSMVALLVPVELQAAMLMAIRAPITTVWYFFMVFSSIG